MKKNLATTIALGLLAVSLMPMGVKLSAAEQQVGLSDSEQAYYDTIFNYTMDNIQPDKSFDWKSYSGSGSIKVGEPFISKSSSNCRAFVEDYTIQSKDGEYQGVACRRSGSDGWCHLKVGDMLSCALEKPGFHLGMGNYSSPGSSGTSRSFSLPDVSIDGSVSINVPHFNGPGMPNMPHMPSGKSGTNNNKTQQQATAGAHDGNPGGSASGAAYSVTDTLGKGAAEGTGAALGWFQDWFR